MFMLDWCWNTFVKAWIVHVWPRTFLMILIFLLWILCQMSVILCWIVVSHRLNTKETLPKFSRNLTLNHIGEFLGSKGGKLRKPKMKTLFWCHRNVAPNPCSLGCTFQSQKPWDFVFKTDPDMWKIFPRFRNGLDHDDRSSVEKVMPV